MTEGLKALSFWELNFQLFELDPKMDSARLKMTSPWKDVDQVKTSSCSLGTTRG